MTAVTVTESDIIGVADGEFKAAIEAIGSTNTNDRFLIVPYANSAFRVLKISIA